MNLNVYVEDIGNSPLIVITFYSQIALASSFALILIIKKMRENQDLNLVHPSYFRSRRGKIKIGKVVYKGKKLYPFYLNIEDLKRHMCIIGATGTGKSNYLQYFLKNLVECYDIPFLLNEFKGEYIYLQEVIPNLVVLKPGENFSINIFDPLGSDSEIHIERIIAIFREGGLFENIDYSPQMERVLYDILLEVCKNTKNRNWESFNEICTWYLAENKNIIRFLDQTIFALRNRIRRYSVGSLKKIFATDHELNIKKLFDMNVLLDLSSIIRLGGRKEDAIFFLNMILKYLWDKNLTIGARGYKNIKHITIVEDSQYFAPQSLTERTKLTSYIEDIAMLLRGTGECLITSATRPAISKEILANAGVIIMFRNNVSKHFVGELINLNKKKEDIISMLKEGYCLVKVSSINRPFLLYTPLEERKWLSEEDIYVNNYINIRTFLNDLQE